jgi:HD-GYP domain-containing protein (c-di-GMP phosphodiesterase class II)
MSNERRKQLGRAGETLLKAIGGLTQIAKMHMDNNVLLIEAAEKFVHLIETLDENEDEVSIVCLDGRFFFQNKKLTIRQANKRMFSRMLMYLENRSIRSLSFRRDLGSVARKKIIAFARLLEQCSKHDEPSDWLVAKLEENDLGWVDVNSRVVDPADNPMSLPDAIHRVDGQAAKKLEARRHYTQVLHSIKDVSRKLSCGKYVGMRNIVRLVQKMVDILSEDETIFSILGTVRIYDDYTYAHSLNVAILSMCLGKNVGLDHISLEKLGLCGLFHDLGKVAVSKRIINKKGRLNDDEYAEIRKHPVHSARLILKLQARRDRKVKILMAPFEHHMGYNRLGYPQIKTNRGISLFSRIVAIADVYDAITSPRVYRSRALSPDRALGYMLEKSGTTFDPVLLKVFINMLGAYPVGTLLELSSGEMGLVMGPSRNRLRPVVQLLVQGADGMYEKGTVVDLSQKDVRTGAYCREISATMHPADQGIQAYEFLS